jgi:hypothetical protein
MLAMARPGALAFLHELANDPNPNIANEARRLLRKHAPHLSPIIERYADTQQRKRAKE